MPSGGCPTTRGPTCAQWTHHPDIDAVIDDLEANGSLTPALNWYRANVVPTSLVDPPLELPPIQAPTMGVWSSGDFALTEEQMTGSADHVAGPWRYERLEGPGHWMPLEAPDEVNGCCSTSSRPDPQPRPPTGDRTAVRRPAGR